MGYPLARVGAFGQGEKRRRKSFRNSEGTHGNQGCMVGQFGVIAERIWLAQGSHNPNAYAERRVRSPHGPHEIIAGRDSPRYADIASCLVV